jgi:hypothetical protein
VLYLVVSYFAIKIKSSDLEVSIFGSKILRIKAGVTGVNPCIFMRWICTG